MTECSSTECDTSARWKRGMCQRHYGRALRLGQLEPIEPPVRIETCTVEECDQPAHARGWCATHYSRWRRLGTVELTPYVTPVCTVSDCEITSYSLGWCLVHYQRMRKYGSFDLPSRPTFADRFHSNYTIIDSGCWAWKGEPDAAGYGRISRYNVVLYAHRVSYELAHGFIDPDLTIDHLCRIRHCVNPEHLELVTLAENVRREAAAKRIDRKNLCRKGLHLLSVKSNGIRYCKTCKNTKARSDRLRAKEMA